MGIMRTAILLAALTGFFLVIGYLVGGQGGMVMAFIVALAMNFFAYWNSDKVVLRLYKARQADERAEPRLHGIVRKLATRAGMPMPKVYIIENDQPNAFATGRNPAHAAVAATTGILRLLDDRELAGVMAHELAHVKNRDTLTMTIAATIGGAIGMLANFAFFMGGGNNRNNPLGAVGAILVMILAPIAAALIQMAISRSREYEADRGGAEISGMPAALASALAKLQHGAARIDNPEAEANPATAHLFIVNPLHAHAVDNLFSTHPNVENRIARLMAMAGGGTAAPMPVPPRRGPWG